MRLICPNCSAQYEIAADMIPPDGREVQCSNCGSTWHQPGVGREVAGTAVADRAIRRAAAAIAEDRSEPADDAPPAVAAAGGPRPMANAETLDILREERAHEDRMRAGGPEAGQRDVAAAERARMAAAAEIARARDAAQRAQPTEGQAPAASPEDDVHAAVSAALADARDHSTQLADAPREAVRPEGPEVDVQAAAVAGGAATAAAAQPRAEGSAAIATPSRPASRRELLPDIEEINSTLRPDERMLAEEEAEAAAAEEQGADRTRERVGFRVGFLGVCALALVGVGLYAFAKPISQAMPDTAQPLRGYVGWVDGQRAGLEARVEALVERISAQDG